MNLGKDILQAAKVVIGSGLASAFLLGANIVLARTLSPSIYGAYATAFALTNGGMFIAVFGISLLMLQEYGRKNLFGHAFAQGTQTFISASTSVACAVVAIVALVAGISPLARNLTFLLLPLLIAQTVAEISSVYFQLTRRAWLTGGWVGVLSFWRFLSCAWFVWTPHNIYALPAYQDFGAIFYTAVSIYLIFRMFWNHSEVGPKLSRSDLLRAAVRVAGDASPYAIVGLMYYAISQLPLILLAAIAGNKAAAIYGVAYLIITTCYSVPQMLMLRSFMLRYHAIATSNRERLRWLYHRGTIVAGIAGGMCAIAFFSLMPYAVKLVFGSKYDESIRLAQIMLVCIPLRFMTVNVSAIVVSGVSVWYKNFADIISGTFAAIIYSVLISRYELVGAAYAAVLAEMMLLASHIFIVEKYLDRFAARNPSARI